MTSMFLVGTISWVFEVLMLFGFLYECRDTTTKRGYILKGGTSLNTIVYAVALIVLFSRQNQVPPSRNGLLFAVGLFFAFLGDMGLATMQRSHGGSSKAIFTKLSSEKVTIQTLTAGVVGVLFTFSFFFQIVAFLKGIHGDVQEFLVPFFLFFLLPMVLGGIAVLLARYPVPDVSTNIFIIALVFSLLTCALFASASVYAFWMYSQDPNHAIFVFTAVLLFACSVLLLAVRYTKPDQFDTKSIRFFSRLLNYVSRMMFAGCAFLF